MAAGEQTGAGVPARTNLGPALEPQPPKGGLVEGLGTLGGRRPLVAGAGMGLMGLLFALMVVARAPEAVAALEGDTEVGEAAMGAPGGPGGAPSAEAKAPPKKVLATPDELDAADTPAKLAALGEAYPDDPAVVKRLALSHAGQEDYSAAIRAVRKLARLTPKGANEEAIQQIVLRAANATPEVMELAFELMTDGMGSVGGDLLYTIATTDKMGKAPKERAEKLLTAEAVRKSASPALSIAVDLRTTRSGCEKKALFPRARDDGDARSLPYLTPLLATSGCGFLSTGDCLKCLGGRQDLREAITAIQARERGAKP